MTLHIAYSNNYDVLKAQLIDAIQSEGVNVFKPLEIVTPSKEIDSDLKRSLCQEEAFAGVAMGLQFERLYAWLKPYGSFWMASREFREILALEIYALLLEIKDGRLQNDVFAPLYHYIEEKDEGKILKFSYRIATVFIKYINYRLDWVLRWLGVDKVGDCELKDLFGQEREAMKNPVVHKHVLWQKELFKELLQFELKRKKEVPDTRSSLEELTQIAQKTVKNASYERKTTPVHLFLTHVIPPLAMPVLAFEAAKREVYLYIMNPSREYWFEDGQSIPKSLFPDWGTSLKKNIFLHTNAQSRRAFIDRIWRFTPDFGMVDEKAFFLDPMEEALRNPEDVKEPLFVRDYLSKTNRVWAPVVWVNPLEFELPKTLNADQSYIWVERQKKSRKQVTLLDAFANSVLKDKGLNSAEPDTCFDVARFNPAQDKSFRVMHASTLKRQIEGVVDWIYAICDDSPDLKGEDILVVTPELEKAAPLIRSVLNAIPYERRLNYRIVGVGDSIENTPIALGKYVFSKATRNDLEELLFTPFVRAALGLKEEDGEVLLTWLKTAGFKKGINKEHLMAVTSAKEENAIVQDGIFEGSLQRALERLTFGFTNGKDAFLKDTKAFQGDESEGFQTVTEREDLLKKLYHLYHFLAFSIDEKGFTRECTWEKTQALHVWSEFVENMDRFFFADAITYDMKAARETFRKAADITKKHFETVFGPDPQVAFDAFWHALEENLEQASRAKQTQGCITFTGMNDVRFRTFKAIAMFGMNAESSFSGKSKKEEFDLTMNLRNKKGERLIRRGDQDSRSDNRNVFLDTLLATGRYSLVCYESGFAEGGVPKNPTPVVEELLEWFESEGIAREKLEVALPINRFSKAGFQKKDTNPVYFFTSVDTTFLHAIKEADPFGEKSIFVTTQDQEGTQRLTFDEFADFWIKPEDTIGKALGFRNLNPKKEAFETSFIPTSSKLFETSVHREIAYALSNDDTLNPKDYVLNTYLRDPRFGFKAFRQDFLSPLCDWALEYKNARATYFEGQVNLVAFQPQDITLDVGEGKSLILTFPSVNLKNGEKSHVYFEALSNAAKERINLLRLCLRLSDEAFHVDLMANHVTPDETTSFGLVQFLLTSKEHPEGMTVDEINPDALPEQKVRQLLTAVARIVLLQKECLVAANKDSYGNYPALWRGLEDKKDILQRLRGGIGKAWMFGTHEWAKRRPGKGSFESTLEKLEKLDAVLQGIHEELTCPH